jgi:hypothetical protein
MARPVSVRDRKNRVPQEAIASTKAIASGTDTEIPNGRIGGEL